MRLFDRGVHKNRTAAAEVDRAVGINTQTRKLRDVHAERAGKRLQKAAAAARAGLVQIDIIDHTLVDFQALHVLAADIENEIDVRFQLLRRNQVRDRLDDAEVQRNALRIKSSP